MNQVRDLGRKKQGFSKIAVIIGIEDYKNEIPALDTPIDDALALAQVLTRYGYEMAGSKAAKSTQPSDLIYQDITGKQLVQLLEQDLPRMVQQNSRFLFYFAGHGTRVQLENGSEPGFLVPSDGVAGDSTTYVSMERVRKSLDALRSHHKLVILDCCHAGVFRWTSKSKNTRGWTNNQQTYREQYESYLKRPVYQVITSAGQQEKALDTFGERGAKNNDGHSPFAQTLIQALNEDFREPALEVFRKDGIMLASELGGYLKNNVKQMAKREQLHDQTPQLFALSDQDGGEFLFETNAFKLANLASFGKKNAYKGLDPYQEEDSWLYFGRQAKVEQLTQLMQDKVAEQAAGQLFIVSGAAKVGKSSFVYAGVVPTLKKKNAGLPSDEQWRILYPKEGEEGIETAVTQTLTKYKEDNKDGNGRLLLILDNLVQPNLPFLKETQKNWDGALHILITTRSDALNNDPHMHQFPLEPIRDRTALQEIIKGPAAQMMLDFEPSTLVDTLIDSFIEPLALPLLSYILHAMYDTYLAEKQEGDAEHLTAQHYKQVHDALKQNIQAVYDNLGEGADRQTMRRIMLRLIEPKKEKEGNGLRYKVSREEFDYSDPDETQRAAAVMADLQERGLLVGDTHVHLAHKQLHKVWDRFNDWQNRKAYILLTQRNLGEAAKNWQSNGESKRQHLWNRHPKLGNVKVLPRHELNKLETTFVEKSVDKREADKRNLWGLITAVIITLSLITVWALSAQQEATRQEETAVAEQAFAIEQQGTAEAERENAQIQEARAIKNEEIAVTEQAFAVEQQEIAEVERENAQTQEAHAIAQRNKAQVQAMLVQANNEYSETYNPQVETFEHALLMIAQGADMIMRDDVDISYQFLNQQARQLMNEMPIPQPTLHHDGGVSGVALSPNGQILASVSGANSIWLWDVADSQKATLLTMLEDDDNSIQGVAFSPDGKLLAANSYDNIIWLWDVADPRKATLLATLEHNDDDIYSEIYDIAFSPNGQTLASAFGSAVWLWDVADPKIAAQLPTQDGEEVDSVTFSPDGQTLAVGAFGTIWLWDVADLNLPNPNTAKLLIGLEADRNFILSVAFSPDSQTLAAATWDATVLLWHVADPSAATLLTTLYGHEDWVNSVAFSPNGRTLASASWDTIWLWDVSELNVATPNATLLTTLHGHEEEISRITFSSDNQTLASASSDNTVRLWNIANLSLTNSKLNSTTPLITLEEHWHSVYSVAFSPDNQILASGSHDTTVILWDVSNPKAITPLTFLEHDDQAGNWHAIASIAFSPNSQILASATRDNTIWLWDVTTPNSATLLATLDAHDDWVNSIAFSPDGQILASASWDGTVRLWDVTDPRAAIELTMLEGHDDGVNSVTFSPDGQTLVSASEDSTVQLWDLSDLNSIIPLTTLEGHDGGINSVTFSPNGQMLASASEDGTVQLWDMTDRTSIIWLSTLEGHDDAVNSVAFSPNGQTLASASADSTVQLWDVSTPQTATQPTILDGHTDTVGSIMFSPDGLMLASGSDDETVRLWPTVKGLVEIACQQTTRNFSWGEWQESLSGHAYKKTCPNLPVHDSLCDVDWPEAYLDERQEVCQ